MTVKSIIGAATVMVLIVCGGASAHADPWGDHPGNFIDGTGPHPDGGTHSYCFESMDSGLFDNIRNAENYALEGNTDANVTFHSECDYRWGTETDVVWDTGNLSGSVRGTTWCDDWDGDQCDQAYVELDVEELRKGTNDEYDITKTACHELGHTVGLTHHSSGYGCMISGEIPSTELKWRRFVDHHKNHIDSWF